MLTFCIYDVICKQIEFLKNKLKKIIMGTSTIIAIVEFVVIAFLAYLIVFRKIGRPLSEAEAQEKIAQKKQKEARDNQYLTNLFNQEEKIKNLKRPVTLISASGDLASYELLVREGNGEDHMLKGTEGLMDLGRTPMFRAIYTRAKAGSWKMDTILIPV